LKTHRDFEFKRKTSIVVRMNYLKWSLGKYMGLCDTYHLLLLLLANSLILLHLLLYSSLLLKLLLLLLLLVYLRGHLLLWWRCRVVVWRLNVSLLLILRDISVANLIRLLVRPLLSLRLLLLLNLVLLILIEISASAAWWQR